MNARAEILPARSAIGDAKERIGKYDWDDLGTDLDTYGCAVIPNLLTPEECSAIAALYPHEEHFRSHIVMARHGFGKGEYRYFSYPLPDLLGGLRTALYARLAPVANEWNARMGDENRYPADHQDYLKHAMTPVSGVRRRYCCNMVPATSTPFTRTSTATLRFRSR